MAEGERQASSRIFISYRREDSAGFVRALLAPLRERFGGDRIFKDTDNIPLGEDFVSVIQRELESCRVLLAVIGSEWASVEDPRTKKRRLDNPNDYLRIEVATALKNEHVIVIPVLVDRAGMPSSEDLPEDLWLLARRNAIELSDSRWDTDVERLVHAIEGICNEPALERKERVEPQPPEPDGPAKSHPGDSGGGFERLELKRKRQIAEHIVAARQAFEIQDFEAVLAACERAIWLDPQEPEARDLAARARSAIDEHAIQERLAEAQQALARGELAAASEAIDEALGRSPNHAGAVKLRQDLLRARQERERQREVDRLVAAELKSARSRFDEEDFAAALSHVEDALALAPESRDALDLRTTIVAARDDLRRLRELKRLAQKAVTDAQGEFANGKHDAALSRLEQFAPPHELVTRALEDLRRHAEEAKETARREKAGQDAADTAARAKRDAVAAEAAAELARREREEQAARDEAARLAAAAAAKARKEQEEQAKREEAARLAAAAAAKARQEQEDQAKREEAATRATREEARRRAEGQRRQAEEARRLEEDRTRQEEARKREEEARKREEALGTILTKVRNEPADQVAIDLLNEGLTMAPGDGRLQTLIGERSAALERRRAEALEKAAAEEALRREQERQAREQKTRREREEKEERARLALVKKEEQARQSRERLAREAEQEAEHRTEEAAGTSEPRPVSIKHLGAAAAAVIAIVAVGVWLAQSPAPATIVQPGGEGVQEPPPPASPPATAPRGAAPPASPPATATRGTAPPAGPPATATRGTAPPARPPATATRGTAPPARPPATATRGAVAPAIPPPATATSVPAPPVSPPPATATSATAPPATPPPATATSATAPPVSLPPATATAGTATPAASGLAVERAAIQSLVDRYAAAYSSMDEQRLKAIDPSFRGISRRELIKSVTLTLEQSEIDVSPDGQSARLKVTGNFRYVWNRAGLPPTSPAQWTWSLRKLGTTWTVVP